MGDSPINDVIYMLIWSGSVIIFTLFAMFAFGGITDPNILFKYQIYAVAGMSVWIVIIALKFTKQSRDENLKPFRGIIHDPEDGMLSKYDFIRNPYKLFLISIIGFMIWGIFATVTNTFASIPNGEISPLLDIPINVEPADWAETGIITFLHIMQAGLLMLAAIRYFGLKGTIALFQSCMFIAAIPVGFIEFPLLHNYIYADQEQNIAGVTALGGGCTLMTATTMSIIPCYVFHGANNGFKKSSELFADEYIILATIVIIFLLILLYYWSFIRKKR